MVSLVRSLNLSLTLASGSERMGQLGHGEDALPGAALDLLLAHPPKQAEVILLHRLIVAPQPEFADLAMVVQVQFGRRLGTGYLLHYLKKTFGLPQITVES